jgi:hypothetical protein
MQERKLCLIWTRNTSASTRPLIVGEAQAQSPSRQLDIVPPLPVLCPRYIFHHAHTHIHVDHHKR